MVVVLDVVAESVRTGALGVAVDVVAGSASALYRLDMVTCFDLGGLAMMPSW